jgi:hypothetical protein
MSLMAFCGSIAFSASVQSVECAATTLSSPFAVTLVAEGEGTRIHILGSRAAEIATSLKSSVPTANIARAEIAGASADCRMKSVKPLWECNWQYPAHPMFIRYFNSSDVELGSDYISDAWMRMHRYSDEPRTIEIDLQAETGYVYFEQYFSETADHCLIQYADGTSESAN